MKKAGLIAFIAIFAVTQLTAQKKYIADPAATKIKWHGEKIVGSKHDGTIALKEGWLASDGKSITGGEFVVDMSTIKNEDIKDAGSRAKLEGHLKSADFFGVDKYPLSKLVLAGGSQITGGKATLRGSLTIKEATHPVEFTVVESKAGDVLTYTATITFDRSLYDVRFGSGKFFSNLGDNAIRDEIKLEVSLVVK
ncbi:YceI family protein [bacterium]|jgi:polyisoprenoid-binding protein YceI|nr:YceI family protein [bacterium]